MKLFHTSDWHLAHQWMGKTRVDEHQAFLTWLVEKVKEEEPDALLVSGDIFDHGLPPHEVQKLYYESLIQLKKSGCPNIILTGGNHDSVSFLEASKELCQSLGIRVFAKLEDDLEKHLCPIHSKKGDLLGHVFAIPYLRERDLRDAEVGQSMEGRREKITEGFKRVYQSISVEQDLPTIAMGHFFASGSTGGDTERELYLGELEAIPIDLLGEQWSYIALGHLHRSQAIGEHKRAWYSGTPLPMSFNEAKRDQVLLEVNFENTQEYEVKKIEIPRFRTIVSLKVRPDELKETLAGVKQNGEFRTWVEVCLTESRPWEWISNIIETMLSDKPIDVLAVRFELETSENEDQDIIESLDLLSPQNLFETYLDQSDVQEEDREHLVLKFKSLCEELALKGASF